jgi:hypothetical protein
LVDGCVIAERLVGRELAQGIEVVREDVLVLRQVVRYLLIRLAVLGLFCRRALSRRSVFEQSVLAGARTGDVIGDFGEGDPGLVGEFRQAGCVVKIYASVEGRE